MNINWTTVVSSAVVAVTIGSLQLIANRYIVRMLDRIEKLAQQQKRDCRGKPE